MKFLILSDDAFDQLKAHLAVSETFEPATMPYSESDAVDQEIVNWIRLAIHVDADPMQTRERLTREVDFESAAGRGGSG